MQLIPTTSYVGPMIIAGGCGAGAVLGGALDGWFNRRGGWIGAPGILFGTMVGGLLASIVVDCGGPIMRLVQTWRGTAILDGAPVSGAVASGPASQPRNFTLDPNRPSLFGRLLQALATIAVVLLTVTMIWLLARPIAVVAGVANHWIVLAVMLLGAAGAILAWRLVGYMAVRLDLTAE